MAEEYKNAVDNQSESYKAEKEKRRQEQLREQQELFSQNGTVPTLRDENGNILLYEDAEYPGENWIDWTQYIAINVVRQEFDISEANKIFDYSISELHQVKSTAQLLDQLFALYGKVKDEIPFFGNQSLEALINQKRPITFVPVSDLDALRTQLEQEKQSIIASSDAEKQVLRDQIDALLALINQLQGGTGEGDGSGDGGGGGGDNTNAHTISFKAAILDSDTNEITHIDTFNITTKYSLTVDGRAMYTDRTLTTPFSFTDSWPPVVVGGVPIEMTEGQQLRVQIQGDTTNFVGWYAKERITGLIKPVLQNVTQLIYDVNFVRGSQEYYMVYTEAPLPGGTGGGGTGGTETTHQIKLDAGVRIDSEVSFDQYSEYDILYRFFKEDGSPEPWTDETTEYLFDAPAGSRLQIRLNSSDLIFDGWYKYENSIFTKVTDSETLDIDDIDSDARYVIVTDETQAQGREDFS